MAKLITKEGQVIDYLVHNDKTYFKTNVVNGVSSEEEVTYSSDIEDSITPASTGTITVVAPTERELIIGAIFDSNGGIWEAEAGT